MDPLASHPTAFPDFQQNYLDSNRSSSCSRLNNTRDRPLPPVPGAKLRLMCSYGGHIIPRPHDKSLCYIGGDTRIVVVDRLSSLYDIHARLSHTLLNGNKFAIKYQLPNEDLDSLVSVTSDEDLQHMIEAYDRAMLVSPNLKPSRLRLFLFLEKIETAASMGCLLDDAKSETWFVDAFNNAGFISRGLSDSAAVDNLLELHNIPDNDSFADLEAQNHESLGKNAIQEVNSTMPDSPMVDTTSSFESTVSSQSIRNLLPVAVKGEDNHMNATFQDQILGLYERFSHINVASNEQKLDDGYNHLPAAVAPALPTVIGGADAMLSAGFVKSTAANDDEKTDHVAPTRLRKLLLRSLSIQKKNGDGYILPSPDSKCAGYNLPSPDSVASDSSIASATSLAKHTIYQEATHPLAVIDSRNNSIDPNSPSQMQQVQDSVVIQASQQNLYQQPQFIPPGAHYIKHTATGPVTTPSYYPMYALQSQQPIHQQMDQQYQLYLIPVPQMTMQSNICGVASSQHLAPPNPPILPTNTVTSSEPEMAANAYRTATPASSRFLQVPTSQFQQQYCGLSQFSPPSQPLAALNTAIANLSYEYSHPTHDQVYYAQHPAPPFPLQYQTMTPTAVLFSQASAQLAAENTTSQNITS
ncbi:PREDICTED: uncharacterized protein LOC109236250 [Nicotiana attenuata]|uniref:PB1 domain-containing protein n=1 Tax=Nicotiana attenuata TaxID=49451 RepID=A0A1J6HV73_NICAT|nr:PREDICTED: uncharacterized protein LOC109236250 [Nicotiana attenuata]OIS96313.1 hypothetical protein A4A49_35944 [Nicotiana attenuata]